MQYLLAGAANFASCVYQLVREYGEFLAFESRLFDLNITLSVFGSPELAPLMELPSVGIGRARLLHRAGFSKLSDVAKTNADELVSRVQHLLKRTALQLIVAANLLLNKKLLCFS